MKYRVMFSGGITDFDKREDAEVLLTKKRLALRRARVIDGEIPSCSIHECGHDEGKPCVNWQYFRKR